MQTHVWVHFINVMHVVKADLMLSLGRPVVARAIALKDQQLLYVIADFLVEPLLDLISLLPDVQVLESFLVELVGVR